MAINQEALINYAATSYVREAMRTGSIDEINSALSSLISSRYDPRTEDSALELEWLPEVEALGADPVMIAILKPFYKTPVSRRDDKRS